jgi:dihydropyrimidinase
MQKGKILIMKVLIKNGTIVTSSDIFRGDVLIEDEKISTIASSINAETDEVIDAYGKLVIPGGVDVHTHFQLPVKGTVSADGFESGTKSAVYGGVTTFIDFAHQVKGESPIKALEDRINEAKNEVYIDYGLHYGVTDFNDNLLELIPEFIRRGVPSFKLYMVYKGLMSDDAAIYAMLQAVREYGGLVIVHAENSQLVDFLTRQLEKSGKIDIPWLPRSRPDFVEIEAIRRVLYLTEITKSRLYVVHVSTGEGAALIASAKGRGVTVFGETCPQYLTLTEEAYKRPEGYLYTCNPPLRTKADKEALWKGLSMGALQVISTDHCSFTTKQKEMGKIDFTSVPNGLPGIETLLPLSFSEGVKKGRLSLSQWVDCISTNPAKMFGLYPIKGTLAPGADADVVVFDPDRKKIIEPSKLHNDVDYSPYSGMEVEGWPEVTISRGRILLKDGNFFGEKGWGKFIPRKYEEILLS